MRRLRSRFLEKFFQGGGGHKGVQLGDANYPLDSSAEGFNLLQNQLITIYNNTEKMVIKAKVKVFNASYTFMNILTLSSNWTVQIPTARQQKSWEEFCLSSAYCSSCVTEVHTGAATAAAACFLQS